MRYNANLMINLESPIILPYFFICLVKVSLLVGNLFFVGGDVGVAVLGIVAVLDILECLVELVVINSLAYKLTKSQQLPNTSTH